MKSESDTISDGNSRQKLAIKSNFILTGENKFSMVWFVHSVKTDINFLMFSLVIISDMVIDAAIKCIQHLIDYTWFLSLICDKLCENCKREISKIKYFFWLINTLFVFHQDNNNQIDLNVKLMSSPYEHYQTQLVFVFQKKVWV